MQKIYDIGIIPRQTGLAERFMFPFSQLNFLLNGGKFDRVTLITSSTDNGKSTLASQILCSVIKQGYKACAFFGEDTAYESQDRIFKQFSRAEDMVYVPYKVNDKNTNCGEWILSETAYQSAQEQFSGKLFLYNTNASTKVEEILDGFEQARTENGCRVFLLDNCEMFDTDTDNENKAMKDNILQIREYAINHKVHIILISHIRKLENGKILPNLDDVKGTSSIVNISKNVLIVVRMDKVDHESKEYKSLRKLIEINNYNLDEADSLVFVAKTKGRKLGFCCLKYNKQTNTYYECKKIDEKKDEPEKTQIIIKRPSLIPLNDDEELFGDI